MQARPPLQQSFADSLAWLHRGFDATATWVTQLSWWKFFLFAALSLIAASIVQDELFSGSGEADRGALRQQAAASATPTSRTS